MKKIHYESWIAKTFLWNNFSTITLTAFVCTTMNEEEMPQSVKNHECTHARQWVEMFVLGWFVIWVIQLFTDISSLWYILSFFSFYLWYVLEYLVKLIFYGRKAYKNISFEREARMAENDETYLENGDYFVWVKYLK